MPQPQRPKKPERKPLLIFFPIEIVDALNRAVEREDTDRSKFIRAAVRRALNRAS